jgi:hypothetical protein
MDTPDEGNGCRAQRAPCPGCVQRDEVIGRLTAGAQALRERLQALEDRRLTEGLRGREDVRRVEMALAALQPQVGERLRGAAAERRALLGEAAGTPGEAMARLDLLAAEHALDLWSEALADLAAFERSLRHWCAERVAARFGSGAVPDLLRDMG